MTNPRTTYYWFQTFYTAGFTATSTAYTPFLRSIGLTLSDIALINVVFWFVAIFAELPTGLFADSRGRGWSLKIGAAIQGIGALVYFTAHGFWSALAGEVTVGIGSAFISGALSAWITDALRRRNEAEELRHVFATAAILRGVAALGAGFLGAFIGVWSLRAAWLLDASFFIGAAAIAFLAIQDQGEPEERITEWQSFRESIRLLRARRALQWGIGASMVFGLVVPFNHYWSLYFREETGQVGLGFVFGAIYLAVTFSGFLVRRARAAQGNEGALIAVVLVATGAGLGGLGLTNGLMIPIAFTILHEIGRGAFEPLIESFTQHRVESSYRATYGSLHALLGRLGFGITLIGVWATTRGLPNTLPTIRTVLVTSGALLAGLALILLLFRPQKDG